MLIKYILLKQFKRMPFLDLEMFEHNFNTKLLMIVGGNGTGKSSLVNELTPLPSDRNNFNKNGYKEIHIEKDKQLFQLISDFTDGVKYYFYLDGENLNISNNITTQKELVYKYFNITPTIHDILIGVENFTDMSLLNRKKLFNSITHLNIDKVIDNYNTLKEELKNNEFLLKTQISLSQAEEQKLSNEDHINNLLNTQKQIKEYIDTLLNIRTELYRYKSNTSLDTTYTSFKDTLNRLDSILTNYYTYITSYPTNEINSYRAKLEVTDYKLSNLYSSLEHKQQEVHILNLNKEHDIASLKNQSQLYQTNSLKLIKSLKIITDIDCNLEDIRNNVYKLEASISDTLRIIPINTDKKYSKEKYDNLLDIKKLSLEELNNSIGKEIELNKELEHLTTHKEDITCPSCSFKWSPIDANTKVKQLKIEINKLSEKKLKLQTTIKETDKSIEEIVEYFNIYKQYANIRNSTLSSLKPFWDIVDREQYIFTSPEYIIALIKVMTSDVISIEEILNIQKTLKELNKNIEILDTLKDTNLLTLQISINEIVEDIYTLQLEKDIIRAHITNNEIANKVNGVLNTTRTALERSRSDLFNSNVSFTIDEVLNVIESELSKYKVILIETEKEINNYNNIKYTLDKYKRTIEDIQSNVKVLNIILDEISPKNGLIAKSVSSFLNIIITNINSIINNVWEYKMVLKAINVEDEVLNYKFKVEVEDKIVIGDINMVSSGMKEIINLSFKMILYKLLKLENYPIYLDEFGVKLDKVHRSKISDLVFKMMNSNVYSQIFMITHLDMMYSSVVKDVEVLELG